MFLLDIRSVPLELAEKHTHGGSARIARHRLQRIIGEDRLTNTRQAPEKQQTTMRKEPPGADMHLLHALLAEQHIDAQENER